MQFPIDIQELSITLTSKLGPDELKLVTDPQKLSSVNMEAKNTFIEQQKWFVDQISINILIALNLKIFTQETLQTSKNQVNLI